MALSLDGTTGISTDGGTTLIDNATVGGDLSFADNGKAIFGAGSDLQIYHDGSNSIINDNGTGNLQLQVAGSIKLTTTATGVGVTGDVGGDTLTISGAGSVEGLTVGRGAGAQANNTVVGASALAANTTGNYGIAIGNQALQANTTGEQNSAAGGYTLVANTTGSYNAGFGTNALLANTTGSSLVAIGVDALFNNTTASNNTAVGYQAGYSNTTGTQNVFLGTQAGSTNTIGVNNVAVGFKPFFGSAAVTGGSNAVVGNYALYVNTTGTNNTGIGQEIFQGNTTGNSNTAVGSNALRSNTTASNNTAVGYQAGYSNVTGTQNVFLGVNAGYTNNSNYNVFIGMETGKFSTGTLNCFVGYNSGYNMTSGTKNTILGNYTGNNGGLNISTLNNYIVLSDGDGNPRYRVDNHGNLQNAMGMSNSLFRQISRGGGNATETFTQVDMGMTDNVTCLINVSIGGSVLAHGYGGTLIYWYMPYGGNSVIQATLVAAFKGSGVTTFSVSASGNSLVVSKDSGIPVSVTIIGGGGTSFI